MEGGDHKVKTTASVFEEPSEMVSDNADIFPQDG